VDLVVSSLREADEVVQSAIAAVSASRGGLTDKARVDLTDRLEARARGIEESIKGQSSFLSRNLPSSRAHFAEREALKSIVTRIHAPAHFRCLPPRGR